MLSLAGVLAGLLLGGCVLLPGPETSRTTYERGSATVREFRGMPDGPPTGEFSLSDASYGEDQNVTGQTARAVYVSDDGWTIALERFTADGASGDVAVWSPQSQVEGGWTAIGSVGQTCEAELAGDFTASFAGDVRCVDMAVTSRSGADDKISIDFNFLAEHEE